MTAAEKLQAMGEEKGREQVAINSLKEGVNPQFVARITGLELTAIVGTAPVPVLVWVYWHSMQLYPV